MNHELILKRIIQAYDLNNNGYPKQAIQAFQDIVDDLQTQNQDKDTAWIIEVLQNFLENENENDGPKDELITDWAEQFRKQKKPSIKWDGVIGMAKVKTRLRELLEVPIKYPNEFADVGFSTGILLYGPPGTGKTMLVAALADVINCNFLNVKIADLLGMYQGQSEKSITSMFAIARKLSFGKPTILFMDEVDSLLGKGGDSYENRVKSLFLQEMDGFDTKGATYPLFLIGASNRPEFFEANQARRFEEKIYVPLPDLQDRIKILQYYTRSLRIIDSTSPRLSMGPTTHQKSYQFKPYQFKTISDPMEDLAMMLAGYSSGELNTVCRKATLATVGQKTRVITLARFQEILKEMPRTVTDAEIKQYERFANPQEGQREQENKDLERELVRRCGCPLSSQEKKKFKLIKPHRYHGVKK